MSTATNPALWDSGKAAALSVGLGLSLVLFPPLVVLALPAMPIPVAYITYRYGVLAGLATGMVAGVINMLLLGALAGLLTSAGNALTLSLFISLFIFMLIAVVGAGAGLGLKRGFSQRRLFLLLAVGFFVCLGLSAAAFVASAITSADGSLQNAFQPGESMVRDFNLSMGASEDQITEELRMVRYMTPAVLLIMSLVLSGATMAMARRTFNRLKQPFPRDFVFREFKLHFVFAYVMIIGLVCELSATVIPESYVDSVSVVGMNLIFVAEVLFFIQGIAIASWFLWKYKLSKTKRAGIYIALVALQVLLSIVSWMGLFDTWIDYRKRFGSKPQQNR